jgi:DNA recombination protein RmuC
MNGSIKELMKQTNLVRGEASNLASALKGDSKSQGNWGEMILERMLEESGLSSPREYVTQEPHIDQQGRRRLPDVIIHMPDQRDMVIDSKVSLTDYERYKNEPDVVEQKKHLKQHINSVKVHIKELHEKSYEQLEGINTLDFVLLFIPIEGAFMLALQNDDMLFNDAYKKNIILSSPSTLMAMLKIVKNVWRFEDQNRNSQRISDEAGKLYDQMALVIESLDNIGEHIEKSQNAFEMAKKRMKTGKGNLMNRFDTIKKLGPNTKRNISQAWIDQDKNKEHLSLKHDLDDKK